MISLGDKATWFWDLMPHDALIVSLGEILSVNTLLRKIKAKGIHGFLGFQGKILLSSIMPDELLDSLTKEKYIELISEIEPDAAMVLDCYTYIDDPLIISWQQLIRFVNNAIYAIEHVDIPLLGIIKGANPRQVSWCVEKLSEMGFRTLVLPRRELVRSGWIGKKLFDCSLEEIETCYEKEVNVLVYGKPFLKDLLENPKICFASLSWFLRAKVRDVYIGEEVESLQNNILFKCDCSFCRGRRWNEILCDVKSIALHNLSQIIGFHRYRGRS